MKRGIIPAWNMIPKQHTLNLAGACQTDDPEEVKKLMLRLSMMKSRTRTYNGYLIYQGGVNEVEEL